MKYASDAASACSTHIVATIKKIKQNNKAKIDVKNVKNGNLRKSFRVHLMRRPDAAV